MFIADQTDLTMEYLFSDDDKSLYIHDEERRLQSNFIEEFVGGFVNKLNIIKRAMKSYESEIEKIFYEQREPSSAEKYRIPYELGCLDKDNLYSLIEGETVCSFYMCVCCGKNLNALNTAFNDEIMCINCEDRQFKYKDTTLIDSLGD